MATAVDPGSLDTWTLDHLDPGLPWPPRPDLLIFYTELSHTHMHTCVGALFDYFLFYFVF